MGNQPDLGAPGKPLDTWIDRPDGTRSLYPVPQTKWDNCAHLMRELKGRLPTDDELALWQLTRPEYEHFLNGQPHGQLRPAPLPQDGLNGDRHGHGQR
jgi:hypothetical protein